MSNATVKSMKYGRFELFINWIIGFFMRRNFRFTNIDPSNIRDSVGFHSRSEPFIIAMDKMLKEIAKGPITPIGRVLIRSIAIKALKNRIGRDRYLEKNPEVRNTNVEAPIFIVGFPRTGTTALQTLLAAHPEIYAPPFWELVNPFPLWAPRSLERFWRKYRAFLFLRFAYWFAPEQSSIHEIRWYTPEEDWHLMAQSFAVMNQDWQFAIPEFGDWLMEQDLSWAYEDLKLMYQILLHQNHGKRLLVKCPDHLCFLKEIFTVFPDASVIWTHRDPAKVIPSYSSLTSLLRRVMFGDARPQEIGPYISDRFNIAVNRGSCIVNRKIYNIAFSDFVENQLITVQLLCARLGLSIEYGAMTRIVDEFTVMRNKRSDNRGKHRYDATMFGIKSELIWNRFESYMNKFHVKREK